MLVDHHWPAGGETLSYSFGCDYDHVQHAAAGVDSDAGAAGDDAGDDGDVEMRAVADVGHSDHHSPRPAAKNDDVADTAQN